MRRMLLFPLFLLSATAVAAPPPLPDGLQEDKKQEKKEEPALPLSLQTTSTPPLPSGLSGEAKKDLEEEDETSWTAGQGLSVTGFAEFRAGLRLQRDPDQKAPSIGETRLQLSLEREFSFATATVTADAVYDPVMSSHGINLETGNGWLDLREANLLMRPTSFADLKLGRQILTWGTGDLLFVNDMFPKDWNAFFIGRDTEYLKAPSDAVKLALFSDAANLDIVYTPRFDADRFIDGRRISYYNAAVGGIVGRNAVILADRPDNWFSDDEWAARLYRNMGTTEIALYFYDGYWKSPAGQDTASGLATFPRLRTYGASARRPFLGGIANMEIGFYDSPDDPGGTDPLVANSEFRFLAGFEREIAPDLTGAVQYYLERLRDYETYTASLLPGMPVRDKARHVLTARLTKLARNQTVTWSLFAYYSPSDRDAYLRPKVSYKLTDTWLLEAGANLFFGAQQHTFFGQFERNNNIFSGVRFSF